MPGESDFEHHILEKIFEKRVIESNDQKND
jgi:hypothetical protein